MFGEKKRLFLLVGLLVAAGCTYVAVHGVPWSGSEDEIDLDLGDLGDAGTVAAAKPDGTPNSAGTSSGTAGASHSVANARRPSHSAGPSPRSEIVYEKVRRVAQRPKPAHLPHLKKAVRSGDERIREAAAIGIGRLGESSDPDVLISALRNDRAATVRAAAATALGRLNCWEAGPALIDALEDPDTNVRSRAGAALRKIMGVDFHYRANDPDRAKAIQKIRKWWPEFYDGHLGRNPRRKATK